MLLSRNVVSSWLLLLWLCPAKSSCPAHFCTCQTDEKGRKKTSCLQGGMLDPIPIEEMDPAMEILEISAPDNDWNDLSLGPIFQNFKSLQELYIWRSSVQQIGMHAFWGVPSLKVLNLKHNNLSTVSDHNFRGLVNLLELNLDDNRIASLPGGAFKHLTELRILTLQNNKLKELVPRVFFKLSKLQVLKISGNRFEELDPEVFKDIVELRVFECRRCTLRRINTQIYHLLPYLTHLDLGWNRFQFLDAEEFIDAHRLHTLKLDGNQLPVILERTFVHQTHLKSLCLSRNRLAKITNTAFLNLTSLVELDISYNKLSQLEPESLHPVVNTLQRLSMGGNYFSEEVLKVIFQIINKVRDLSLSHLTLLDVPDGIPNHVTHLNLSLNHISNLSIQLLPHHLIALDISRNKFRGLEEHVIQRLLDIKEVDLSQNSWSCDVCNISPLMFNINRSIAFQSLTCASPKLLKGRLISSLSYEEVKPCVPDFEDERSDSTMGNKLSLFIGGASILAFLLFCVAFVVFSCVRRHARSHQVDEKEKRIEEKETVLENPTVIFGSKGDITFKFPLDLTERKLSVSTIDEIKKDTQLNSLPNGTGALK